MYHGAGLQGRGHKLACWLCPGTTQGLFHRSLFHWLGIQERTLPRRF